MTNLFDNKIMDHYIGRINSLKHEQQRQWGKMDVAQMLTHCQRPFLIADGTLKLKPNKIIRFLFGKMARRNLLAGKPFPRNSPTFPEAIVVDKREFEKERAGLIEAIRTFNRKGPGGITITDHPFFGEMNPEIWSLLLSTHLNHHLEQFGA
jgi:hypothetical protein